MISFTTYRSKTLWFLCWILICFHDVSGQENPNDEQLQVQQVVRDLFEAFSQNDFQQMKSSLTPDVLILEHGVVWNMDTLVSYTRKQRPPDFRRVNAFNFFETEIGRDIAFVSYYNEANITANDSGWHLKWLETAILVKENKRWKIKTLHSTRIERTRTSATR
jgi:ketosteroid isomerase-like protein